MKPGPAPLPAARLAAAAVSAAAWAGLAAQLHASTGTTGSPGAAIWAMLFYFTVISNLLVAGLFAAIALGRAAGAPALGGATITMALVGIIYALLLDGLIALSGGAATADLLLHRVVPLLVAAWWLGFAPKGGLSLRTPLAWTLLPLAYFAYGLIRGRIVGHYPYPFMNVGELGWPHTMAHALVIAIGFLIGGYALVGIDRLLARRGK